MKDSLARALDAATAAGASYADCRGVRRSEQEMTVKDGSLANLSQREDEGIGIRVLLDGAWGFAAVGATGGAAAEAAALRAVAIARAAARVRVTPVRLAPQAAQSGEYRTPVEADPFLVPIDDKIALLLRADAAMAAVAGITTRTGSLACVREERLYANTEGSEQRQLLYETGGGLDAMAVGDGEVQVRSYPNSFGRHQQAAGWEFIEQMQLETGAPRIAEEAVQLLTAPPCPAGRMTVILDATQTALQVHESCGHPTELDRVFGSEAAYAGMSFLLPEMRGHFMYGSEQVSIVADATSPGGLGTFGWDDEGVPAQRAPLVDRGRFVGYMTSRETAQQLGETSNGTMRGFGWSRVPIIRMTNVNLEPGISSLEEMIATTKHGVYLETNRSWSIDDVRLNFQFGTQVGWEIVDGKRMRMVRNPIYSGITPEFWGSCDAVAGRDEWHMWGVVNCGKGQPSQVMHVGHGAAPSRFQNVAVRPA